jgi:adenylate cyclase
MAGDAFAYREVDRVILYGHGAQTTVHELVGKPDDLSPDRKALQTAYAEGLEAYRQQRWPEAREALAKATAIAPGDGPCRTLLSRIQDLERGERSAAWDGSWRMDRK